MVSCEHCGAPLIMGLLSRCRGCGQTNGWLRTMHGRTAVTQAGARRIVGNEHPTPRPTSAAPRSRGSKITQNELDLSHAVPGQIQTWSDAESVGLVLLRELGFLDAVLTKRGSDGGIDVTSSRAVCQVKRHEAQVGRPDIQRLHGAALGKTAVFLATRYTREAMDWAGGAGVALFTFDTRGTVRAESPPAMALLAAKSTKRRDQRAIQLAGRVDTVTRWHRSLQGELRRLQREPAGVGRARRARVKQLRSGFAKLYEVDVALKKVHAARSAWIASSSRADAQLEIAEKHLRQLAKILDVTPR